MRFWELPVVAAVFGSSGVLLWAGLDLILAAVVLIVGMFRE